MSKFKVKTDGLDNHKFYFDDTEIEEVVSWKIAQEAGEKPVVKLSFLVRYLHKNSLPHDSEKPVVKLSFLVDAVEVTERWENEI